ncbi:hypothetical protein PIB30_059039 [Stylosanthes scabra]|uniref:Uncharacterized protein n=1 Tax=Stylosanthes scabra TaxID=79078 RepID=A0ABU6UKZ0_9FABA|nr:hypothetical protein [Stylosanthes scabra]
MANNCFRFDLKMKDGKYFINKVDIRRVKNTYRIKTLLIMKLVYIDWGVFFGSVKDDKNALVKPNAMKNLYVRDILPCSIKILIKEHLELSYIDEGAPSFTHSTNRRRPETLNQATESSDDSGESTDEEYRSYLTMLRRRHNETSDDD